MPWPGVGRLFALFGVYSSAAVYASWPLARVAGREVAFSTGDPALSAWIFGWAAHAVVKHPFQLFSANMFSPETLGLAYSENMLGMSLPFAPVFWLTGNAVLAENLALLAWLAIGGLGTYLLVRRLTANRWASFAAGLAFAVAPYRLSQITHPHVVGAALIPFLLLALLCLGEAAPPPRRRQQVLAAAAVLAAQFWVSLNGGVFALAAVGAWGAWELARHRRQARPTLLRGAAAAGVGIALSLPVLVPYVILRQQNPRYYHPTEEIRMFSATPGSYLTPFADGPVADPVTTPMFERFKGQGWWEKSLFPGFVLTGAAVAAAGFAAAHRLRRLRRRPPDEQSPNAGIGAAVGLGAAVAGSALVLSFGPRWGGRADGFPLPFVLVESLFSGVARVPARFGVLVPLGLAVCLGALLTAVRPSRRPVLAVAAAVLILVEMAPTTIATVALPARTAAHEAVAGRPGAVLALPTGEYGPDGGLKGESIDREALHMYLSTAHFRPMVNGYGAYQTDAWFEMIAAVQDLPSDGAFADLRSRDVQTVIVQTDMVKGTRWDQVVSDLNRWPGVRELARGQGVIVYDISAAASSNSDS